MKQPTYTEMTTAVEVLRWFENNTAITVSGIDSGTVGTVRTWIENEIYVNENYSNYEQPTFYTVIELADLMKVHTNTLYRQIRAGKIKHYKVGAQIRIPASELARLTAVE